MDFLFFFNFCTLYQLLPIVTIGRRDLPFTPKKGLIMKA
jgi:hypothetical protein